MDKGKNEKKALIMKVLCAFIITFVIAELLLSVVGVFRRKHEREAVKLITQSEGSRLKHSFDSVLVNLDTLAILVNEGDGSIKNFDKISKTLIDKSLSKDAIKCLQLAPNGVVTQIYPEKGNEKGKIDLFKDPKRKVEAEWAKRTKKTTLAGPYNLLQGGYASVARKPVYLNDKNNNSYFWGFVVEILWVDKTMETAKLDAFSKQGFSYKLWKYNAVTGKKDIISESQKGELDDPIVSEISMYNTKWYFSVEPDDGWIKRNNVIVSVVLSILLACLIAFFVFREDEKKRSAQMFNDKTLLQSIVDNINCGVVVYEMKDNDLIPVSINSILQDITGVSEELFFKTGKAQILKILFGEEFKKFYDNDKLIEKLKSEKELYIINRNTNKGRWMDIFFRIVQYESGRKMLYISFNDVDEIKSAIEAAKKASEAKTDFLSKISHDIRTPMNAIIGMTDLSVLNIDDKEKVQENLNTIKLSSRHLLDLVNTVLDMRKIEEGSFELQNCNFDIIKMMDNVVNIMRYQADYQNQTMQLEILKVHNDMVIGDQLRVQQIVANIVSNSIKYTQNNGEINIALSEIESDKYGKACFEITVEDNGIGMSEEYIEKIYEPFSRVEDSRTSKVCGTGLGMTIVKNFVDMMGGDIKIESELGKGTKTIVKLYFGVSNAVVVTENEDDKQVASKRNYVGKKVLVVEDQDFNREILTEFLDMAGMEVVEAENGKEAVDIIDKSSLYEYSVIFMDIQMPVLNGYEATKQIRALDRKDVADMPIVAVTANAFDIDVLDAKMAGMDEHFAKPIDYQELILLLAKIFDEGDENEDY